MAITKCPRCELNYILDGASLCPVCQRETKGQTAQGALEICPVCHENPVLPRKDLCLFCLKELDTTQAPERDEETVARPLTLEEPSEIDEIDLDAEDDTPDPELDEISRELSLEDVLAEESEGEDDEDEEEDM